MRTSSLVFAGSVFVSVLAALQAAVMPPQSGPRAGDSRATPDEAASFRVAVEAIDRAVTAGGGVSQLAEFDQLRITLEGASANAAQGHDPADIDTPKTDGRFPAANRFDERAARYAQQTRQDVSGGLYPRLGVNAGALIQTTARFVPGLVRRALDNRASLRHEGGRLVDGAVADLVSFSWDARTRLVTAARRADGRLLRLTVVGADPLDGESESTYRYTDYQDAERPSQSSRIVLERRARRPLTCASRSSLSAQGVPACIESSSSTPRRASSCSMRHSAIPWRSTSFARPRRLLVQGDLYSDLSTFNDTSSAPALPVTVLRRRRLHHVRRPLCVAVMLGGWCNGVSTEATGAAPSMGLTRAGCTGTGDQPPARRAGGRRATAPNSGEEAGDDWCCSRSLGNRARAVRNPHMGTDGSGPVAGHGE